MKVFDISKRINFEKEDNNVLDLMNKEYDFYKSICNDFKIGEKQYKVTKNVNYQCRTTLVCNANCPFCIEKDSCKKFDIEEQEYINKLDKSLKELHSLNINPSVTITGGEPCIYKNKLINILKTLKNNNIKKFNVNTNGILLDSDILNTFKEVEMPHLNISLHHYDLEKNKILFGNKSITKEQLSFIKQELGATYYDKTRIRLQCVLVKGYIDSLEEVKKFLDFAIELGFDNVCFRGLSKLKNKVEDINLHEFCNNNSMEIFEITNVLDKDSDFKFNCQNISDHYMYEDWIYKNKVDVYFTYSDMDILEKLELEELKNDINYAREFVLYEDGNFCGGWNKDIKTIY